MVRNRRTATPVIRASRRKSGSMADWIGNEGRKACQRMLFMEPSRPACPVGSIRSWHRDSATAVAKNEAQLFPLFGRTRARLMARRPMRRFAKKHRNMRFREQHRNTTGEFNIRIRTHPREFRTLADLGRVVARTDRPQGTMRSTEKLSTKRYGARPRECRPSRAFGEFKDGGARPVIVVGYQQAADPVPDDLRHAPDARGDHGLAADEVHQGEGQPFVVGRLDTDVGPQADPGCRRGDSSQHARLSESAE